MLSYVFGVMSQTVFWFDKCFPVVFKSSPSQCDVCRLQYRTRSESARKLFLSSSLSTGNNRVYKNLVYPKSFIQGRDESASQRMSAQVSGFSF